MSKVVISIIRRRGTGLHTWAAGNAQIQSPGLLWWFFVMCNSGGWIIEGRGRMRVVVGVLRIAVL